MAGSPLRRAAYDCWRSCTIVATAPVELKTHQATQAAFDACDEGGDQSSNRLFVGEFDPRDKLAETPCASDSELRAKLKYVHHESRMEDRSPDSRDDFGSDLVAMTFTSTGRSHDRARHRDHSPALVAPRRIRLARSALIVCRNAADFSEWLMPEDLKWHP